jgi:hypothetical protein
MRDYTFENRTEKIGKVPGIVTLDELKNEPMLFNADFYFATKKCGPITKEILRKLVYKDLGPCDKYTINTRVTNCFRGQYPSIPGWHCDLVPRGEKYSQPELDKIDPKVRHAICLVATTEGHSNTEFLDESLKIPYDEKNVWGSIDKYLTLRDNTLNVKTFQITEGDIIQFTQQDLHRATVVKNPGWRLFFRISNANVKPANEIRNQVQVYTPLGIGW